MDTWILVGSWWDGVKLSCPWADMVEPHSRALLWRAFFGDSSGNAHWSQAGHNTVRSGPYGGDRPAGDPSQLLFPVRTWHKAFRSSVFSSDSGNPGLKKYIAPLILKNHVDGHCAACDHTGRPGSCLLCVCKEAMGVIWQWVLGSFDFGHPSAVRREGPTASGDPRDVLSSSAPLPVEVLELHSRTYTSSPFIVLKYIFNAFLELTVINRVDRHVLKVFKKFFSLMAFLPAKGLGAGAMECVCVGGPHLKRRKKRKLNLNQTLEIGYSEHERIFSL